MNATLRKLFYTLVRPSLSKGYSLTLGFIFHTEKIYDDSVFQRLLTFCNAYKTITGKRALCAIMPPISLRVKQEMEDVGATEEVFIQNLKHLRNVADLGFHGHFWRASEKSFDTPDRQIRNSTYRHTDNSYIIKQFDDQVNWLERTAIDYKKSYAAGWWFTHRVILEMQATHGFMYDFSFSKMEWTSGVWGKEMMTQNQVAFGEPFEVVTDIGKIISVQTVMGIPTVPQDIIRIFNSLVDPSNKTPIGMMTTHDYNLDGDNLTRAINQIRYLRAQKDIQFFSIEDLPELLSGRKLKRVIL